MEKLLKQLYCLIEPYIKLKTVEYEITPITKNTVITGEHGVSFKNTGDIDVTISGFPLASGDPMITFPVDRHERDRTTYRITFNVSGTGTKQVWMIRKKRT